MYKKILIFLSLLCTHLHAHFSTLQELQKYAAKHNSSVLSSPIDIQYPDFSSLYRNNQPSWLSKFGFEELNWNAQKFKQLIEDCRRIVQKNKLQLSPESRLYVWGDLYGDMHSLIQTLTYCIEDLKILNTELSIIDKNTYFVFLGNTIGLTPYSLETLTIILTLLSKNPQQVFYIAGTLEQNSMWENTTMADQLKMYAYSLKNTSDFGIPLSYLINTFFKTLPHKISITIHEHQPTLILRHEANNNEQETNGVIVSGESVLPLHQTTGLQFIGYTQGNATWSLISCPTPLYNLYYNFNYNSFACIHLKDTLENSFITSYKQEVNSKQSFVYETFSLLNGTKSIQQQEHKIDPYIIGSLIPLTGNQSLMGNMIYLGLSTGLHFHNSEKNSLLIRDVILDNQNSPQHSFQAMQRLQQMNIRLMLMPVSNSAFKEYYRAIVLQKMYVLFPYSGNILLRNSSLKNVINLLPSHEDELALLIPFMIRHYQANKIAFIYPSDSLERDTLTKAHTIPQQHNIHVTDISYTAGQTDFSKQIELLKANNIDTIGFFGTGNALQMITEQMGAEQLFNKNIFGLSYLNSIELKNFLHHLGFSITITTGGLPNPHNSSILLVKEYQEAMDLLTLPYEYQSLVGFIAAQLLRDALQKLQPPFAPENIIRYFERLNNYNFKGLVLSFDTQTRSLSLRPEIMKL